MSLNLLKVRAGLQASMIWSEGCSPMSFMGSFIGPGERDLVPKPVRSDFYRKWGRAMHPYKLQFPGFP